jgi:hypothetical protein
MYHGYYVALNLWWQIMFDSFEPNPIFMEWSPGPDMMGVAVGKEAVVFTPDDGVTFGEDVLLKPLSTDLSLKGMRCSLIQNSTNSNSMY